MNTVVALQEVILKGVSYCLNMWLYIL